MLDILLAQVHEIEWRVRKTIEEEIESGAWLKEHAYLRKIALEKIRKLQVLIAYPREQLRTDRLNSLYFLLRPNASGDYMQNVLSYLDYFGQISLTGAYLNFVFAYFPFYVHLLNTVAIQGAFLQRPHFDPDWPGYLLYSSLGHVIGHELAHAFDRNGWFYLANGSYFSSSLWPSEFVHHWHEQQACFDDHYKHYRLPQGVTVRSRQTMGENMADVFGLQLAFRSYIRSGLINSDTGLPGFDRSVSPEQLFFVGLGRTLAYCVRNPSDSDSVLETALTDAHAPGKFRLLGMLRNSAEFAKAFGCSPGTYMNPPQPKCSILNDRTS